MSGPGHPDQHNYGNPADLFNNGPSGGSGHDFFDQHGQQQQNWYQQPQAGVATSGANQPAVAPPMFYNPAEYAKEVTAQPAIFDPTQQQHQGEPNQQSHTDNYAGSVNQWDNNPTQQAQGWNYQNQPNQDPNYNYADQQPPGNDYMPNSYGQHPYYSQQSNDTTNHPPTLQWNQDVPGQAWSNQNNVNQVGTNMSQGENTGGHQEVKTENIPPVHEDDDSGGGYMGLFNKDDDDYVESDTTESPRDGYQQDVSPRTQSESNNVIPHDQPPSAMFDQSQHHNPPFAIPQHHPGQEVPYNQVGVEGHSANQSFEGVPNIQQLQNDAPEGQYFPNPGLPAPDGEAHVYNGGPPSEHGSSISGTGSLHPSDSSFTQGQPVAGSLHPSDSSASLTTSRSNSLLEDGGEGQSAPPSSAFGESFAKPEEQSGNSLEQYSAEEDQLNVESSIPSIQADNSVQLLGQQNVLYVPPASEALGAQALPGDISSANVPRKNSDLSEISNTSVPSDTNISRTSSMLAESEQQFQATGVGISEPAGAFSAPQPGGANIVPPPASINVAPSADGSIAPPIAGAMIAPPIVGMSIAPPGNIAPPPTCTSTAPPSTGMSIAPSADVNIAPPLAGAMVAPPTAGMSIAPPVGAGITPPPTGLSIAPPVASIAASSSSTQMLQQEHSVQQNNLPISQPNVPTSANILPQMDQPVSVKQGEHISPQHQSTPQTSLFNPVGIPSVASQASNHPIQTNPLMSGTAHPSAFRTVRAHHNKSPTSAAVNPSPPLWSTEVPALPSNILLAPASVTSAPTPSLSTPTKQPVKLDSNLASSIANVPVPPLPSEVTSLLQQTSQSDTKTTYQISPNVSVPSSNQSVEQVTQHMAGLNVGQPMSIRQAGQPVTTQQPIATAPSTIPAQPLQLVATSQLGGMTPQVPTHGVQSLPSMGQGQQNPVAPSSSALYHTNQSEPVKMAHPVAVMPGGQPVTPTSSTAHPVAVMPGGHPVTPTSSTAHPVAVMPGGQPVTPTHPMAVIPGGHPATPAVSSAPQHGAPVSQQQVPPGQEQWYGGQGHGGQSHGGQGQYYGYHQQYPNYHPHDYRAQYEYDQYYRQQYAKQHQYNRERPYSRQEYSDHDRSYRERDPARSYSRQGYGEERPRSRQGKGYEQYGGYEAYYAAHGKKDPKHYGGEHEDYYRRRGYGYDQRYDEWYRNREYYRQHRSGNKHNRSTDQKSSELDESHNESQRVEGNRTNDATAGSSLERSGFAADFHHTGGDTPEKYGANQSNISAYGDYSNQYNSRGYDQYGRPYNNGYNSTDASWDGYGYKDPYAQQQPAKPATPPPPERLTPCKFMRPHMVARFSSGGHLIKVMPNSPSDGQPALVEVHSVESMLEHNEEYTELKSFPGPLVRNHTHKNDVVRFALQMADNLRKSTDVTDKESAALLWDLLVLLCRQNGTIVGTDISELLLKDHPMTSSVESQSTSQTNTTASEDSEENQEQSQSEVVPSTKTPGPDVEKETHRFRELLLFGRKKEALESAIKGGLWGHALLLSCKMDHRTHLSVMTRFANSLPMNDPLQTLFQIMSNRQPAAVTSCADEKWGDWRPHLAMILSNLIDNANLDVRSITSLGDSLASRGLLFASQFCYLMAQISPGYYSNKVTKMVLLGASHSLPFKEFARRPSIQQTEVFEYAQSLANKKYALPTLQVYKFIHATQLLDYGFVTQALHYCEVVANTIQYSPAYYSPELISQVSELSHRLKYHDHQYFDGREVNDPDWLRDLDHIKIQYEEGAIQPASASETPMPWVESSSNLSQMGESVTSDGLTFDVHQSNAYGGQRVDTPHSEDYGMGGSSGGSVKGQEHLYGGGQRQEQHVQDQTQGFNFNQQPSDGTNVDYQAGQQETSTGFDWNNQQYGDPQQQYGDQQQQYGQQQQQYGEQQQQYGDHQQQQQIGGNYANFGGQPSESTKPANLDLGASANSNFSEYSTTSAATTGESGTDTDLTDSNASQAFDYYGMSSKTASQENGYPGGMANNQYGAPASPTKTMTPPDTPITRTRTRTLSENSNQMTPTPQPKEQPKQQKPKQKKKDNKSGKGWFSGWFRGKNEMHLPDDKDKTIQWDEKRQKWVNVDGDEEEDDKPPPPPPTDHEISGGGPPAPGGGPPAAGGPPPGVNKFSRKAMGRGNYVDIFKGSTMPSKSSSLPPPSLPIPASNAMPTNFFIPQAGIDPAEEASQPQVANPDSRSQTPASSRSRQSSGAQQTPTSTQPQFFNPNSFGSSGLPDSTGYQQHGTEQQDENLSDTSSTMSSLSQEVSQLSQHMNKQQSQQQEEPVAPPPGPAAVTNPMMFNPQAYSQSSFSSQPQSSRRGYGTRRQYPNQR